MSKLLNDYAREINEVYEEIADLQHQLEVWNCEDDYAVHIERRISNNLLFILDRANNGY